MSKVNRTALVHLRDVRYKGIRDRLENTYLRDFILKMHFVINIFFRLSNVHTRCMRH